MKEQFEKIKIPKMKRKLYLGAMISAVLAFSSFTGEDEGSGGAAWKKSCDQRNSTQCSYTVYKRAEGTCCTMIPDYTAYSTGWVTFTP